MKKSACLFIIGLALHGSLGWGSSTKRKSCGHADCDAGAAEISNAPAAASANDDGRAVADAPNPQKTFISEVKAQFGSGGLDPEKAKAAFSKLEDDEQKKKTLEELKELADKESDTEKAKQLADLAAELEFGDEYRQADRAALISARDALIKKAEDEGLLSGTEQAQMRLITKELGEKSDQNKQSGGTALKTKPGEYRTVGEKRVPTYLSPDGNTQYYPTKNEGIVAVSRDGGRTYTTEPEEKHGLTRSQDGSYSQSNNRTVSNSGTPQAIGVIHRTSGKDPAFEYQYTNKDGKQVVGFQNSQGQWVEGNPKANSYSTANAPEGFKVENGRLVPLEKPKPAAAPTVAPAASTTPPAVAAAKTLFAKPFSEWGPQEKQNLQGVIDTGKYDLTSDAGRKQLYDTLIAGGANRETAIRAAEAATNPHRWFDSNTTQFPTSNHSMTAGNPPSHWSDASAAAPAKPPAAGPGTQGQTLSLAGPVSPQQPSTVVSGPAGTLTASPAVAVPATQITPAPTLSLARSPSTPQPSNEASPAVIVPTLPAPATQAPSRAITTTTPAPVAPAPQVDSVIVAKNYLDATNNLAQANQELRTAENNAGTHPDRIRYLRSRAEAAQRVFSTANAARSALANSVSPIK